MPIEHSDIGLAEIHIVHNWEYADAAARTGAAGFIASDLGKWAKQLSDGSFWELTAVTPTWAQRTGSGGAGNVVGPGSATDLAITRYDGTTGKLLQDSAVTIDDNGGITVPEIAAPSTPAAGKVAVYAKSDGKLYIKDDAGTETDLTATGAGGAEAGANSDITSMDGLTGALQYISHADFTEGAAPSTPAANKVALYAKSDGLLYSKDDAGTETLVSGGSGGSIAPLVIESANVVAQRNGANAQTLNIYKTFTDASNYERLRISSSSGSNPFTITSEALGTGSVRDITITSGANLNLNSNDTIQIGGSTAQVVPSASNTIPLGSSTRFWSEIYAVNLNTSVSGGIFFSSASQIVDAGISNGGVIRVRNRFGAGGTMAYDERTPSTIGSDQNDYAPGGPSRFQRWSSNASRNVTGLNIAQVDGQEHVITNVGSNNIVLKHQDAGSTAANRFLCSTGADITLAADQSADVTYDATTQRWRVYKRN